MASCPALGYYWFCEHIRVQLKNKYLSKHVFFFFFAYPTWMRVWMRRWGLLNSSFVTYLVRQDVVLYTPWILCVNVGRSSLVPRGGACVQG